MPENDRKPSLRFKGFNDAWEQCKLGDLGFFKSNGVDKLSRPNEVPVNLLNYMDVYSRRKVSNKNAHELMQVTAKPSQLIENSVMKNDVFFTPTSETPEDIGRVYVIEETLNNTVYSYHLMRFRPNQGTYYPNFPNYSLTTENVRKQFFLAAKGVQRYVISKADFESIVDTIPEYKEQAKIGEFFRSIDHLITLHQRKYDKLVSVKKALLDKMFPENGNDVPKVRFKGFTDAWEQYKFSQILELIKDGTHGTHQNVEEGIFLLSAKNIKNGEIIIDATDRKISELEYLSIHKNFQLKAGDVLLTIVGTIGDCAILKEPYGLTFQRSVAYLRPGKNITSSFLYSTINTSQFQNDLKKGQSISAQAGVYLNELGKLEIKLPSVDEQKSIGLLFEKIDNLITLHQRKHEKFKNIKKSLLQKMFA